MMNMNIFIYDSLTGLTIYQRSADVLSGWTFCQDRLRHFVRKTFFQDRLRRFVRTEILAHYLNNTFAQLGQYLGKKIYLIMKTIY